MWNEPIGEEEEEEQEGVDAQHDGLDRGDTLDEMTEDAETPTMALASQRMWPQECEEDEESSAAPTGVWQPPPTRRIRIRHMDLDESDDDNHSDNELGRAQDEQESEEESEESEDEDEDEGRDDDELEEDEASEQHVVGGGARLEAGAHGQQASNGRWRGDEAPREASPNKWGVQVEIPEHHYHASSSEPSTHESSTTPASGSSSRSPGSAGGGVIKGKGSKKKKKRKESNKLEVGKDNMRIMAKRVNPTPETRNPKL